jgi:uncharacterized membrane protein
MWIIQLFARILKYFLMKYRWFYVAFSGAITLVGVWVIIVSFSVPDPGTMLAVILTGIVCVGFFGFCMYRAIQSPTWPPERMRR